MSLDNNTSLLNELLNLSNTLPELAVSVSFGDIPNTVYYISPNGSSIVASPNTTVNVLGGIISYLDNEDTLDLTGDYKISNLSNGINLVCFKSSGGSFIVKQPYTV